MKSYYVKSRHDRNKNPNKITVLNPLNKLNASIFIINNTEKF
jgi:hypothetical protein